MVVNEFVRNQKPSVNWVSGDKALLVTYSCSTCGFSNNFYSTVGGYTEQGDYAYWRDKYPDAPVYGLSYVDYDSLLETAKGNIVEDSYNAYDLLTELAELKETLSTIRALLHAAREPLEVFYEFKDAWTRARRSNRRTAEYSSKALSDKWLEFQYGIMPIVFSIKDLIDLNKRKHDIYSTTRQRFDIPIEVTDPDGTSTHFYEVGAVSGSISLTGKSRYSGEVLSNLLSGITINPFLTAWELVPYSFVVDWFVNVGDWLIAQTALYRDLAIERRFCYAIKTSGTVDTFLHLVEENRLIEPARNPGVITSCDPGMSEIIVYNDDKNEDLFLKTREWNNYHRVVFQPRDVKLSLSPYLDWKRFVTSISLSVRPLIDALRKLR
jgi:hypothetical protein